MKISEEIKTLIPYKPGKPISETLREYGISKAVKLASNENPLGTNPKVIQAVKNALENQHRYPDPSFFDLTQAVSKKWNIPTNWISAGNGSNEIIDLLIRIFCEPGQAMLTTESAFVAYAVCAQAARVKRVLSKLKPGYMTNLIDMANILEADTQKNIKIVFIPNPNNPTGTYVSDNEVQIFLKKFGNDPDRLIVFDEAYVEYCRAKDYKPAIEYISNNKSVVVLRTLSKVYGLAGFRVGIILAQSEILDYYNRVRNTFNVNDLAQVAAVAALQDEDFVKKCVDNNNIGLDFFYKNFREMNIPFVESQGNFIMFDTLRDVPRVNEEMLKRGLILRPIGNYGFKTEMRITVGLPEENEFAIQVIKEVFKFIPSIKS
jgi:histidinol-phosphate aminotransferase